MWNWPVYSIIVDSGFVNCVMSVGWQNVLPGENCRCRPTLLGCF